MTYLEAVRAELNEVVIHPRAISRHIPELLRRLTLAERALEDIADGDAALWPDCSARKRARQALSELRKGGE